MKRILTTLKEKWPEYLLEIFVLIIGIYGAFAVEAWNEGRQKSEKEKELLISIKNDLEESKKELLGMIEYNEKNLSSLKPLYDAAKVNAPYHHTMDTAFGRITVWNSPFLKSTAYESIKAYGLEFIQNKDLKTRLIDLYENHFPEIVEDYDKSEWTLAQSVTYPYFIGRLDRSKGIATPLDYQKLISEPAFRANLSTIIALRGYGVDLGKKTITEISSTIDLINKEIKE